MIENELSTTRTVVKDEVKRKRIDELKHWFIYIYPSRLHDIEAHRYFKLIPDESLDSLQLEWYDNKQELNSLLGLPPLDEIQRIDLIGGNE